MASWSFSQSNTLPPNGNVGIGTTTPTSTLQVNGCTHIDSSLVVKDSVIIHKSAHIKTDLKVDGITEFNNNVIINQGELKIKNLGDTSLADFGVLVIDGDGKVFNGGEVKSLVYSQEGQIEPPCAVAPNGTTVYHAPDWYRATNPQQMYLKSTFCSPDPRLGVGVKPEAKLHVQLEMNSNLHPLLIEKKVNSNPALPAYKLLELDHKGLLYAREVKVNMDTWPDYVFEKEYDLMPLKQVGEFIEQNGHLPNVPSAKDIQKDGVNLGEMSKTTLEKVEELTLYLIQLQEQVVKQQNQLTEQQKLIEKQQQQINALLK
ncbi:MAG TPA: hypothetical protein PLI97_06765 [Fluviicola sp.]|nr:hypothetical protein [Fluviicola sp.]